MNNGTVKCLKVAPFIWFAAVKRAAGPGILRCVVAVEDPGFPAAALKLRNRVRLAVALHFC